MFIYLFFFFFSSRRRHTRWTGDWSSDVCSSDLDPPPRYPLGAARRRAGIEEAGRGDPVVGRVGAEPARSEERRVGKEGRCRGGAGHLKKKKKKGEGSRWRGGQK